MLPRAFVGLLHVETDCARYKGPTKDVLDVEKVESFVYQEVRRQFRGQWEKLKNERAL
jgi:hypothetical protein